jgi:hypothetical protein
MRGRESCLVKPINFLRPLQEASILLRRYFIKQALVPCAQGCKPVDPAKASRRSGDNEPEERTPMEYGPSLLTFVQRVTNVVLPKRLNGEVALWGSQKD